MVWTGTVLSFHVIWDLRL